MFSTSPSFDMILPVPGSHLHILLATIFVRCVNTYMPDSHSVNMNHHSSRQCLNTENILTCKVVLSVPRKLQEGRDL